MKYTMLLSIAILIILLAVKCSDIPVNQTDNPNDMPELAIGDPGDEENETIIFVGDDGSEWDTGVENKEMASGITLEDYLMQCAEDAKNHGQFVSCVAHLTNNLKKMGYISGKEKGKIMKAAAQADIP